MIWQTYKKEFMLLLTMTYHRCFITQGSRLRFMDHKGKNSQFSFFVAIGFFYRFVLVMELNNFSFNILISGTRDTG